MVDLLWQHGWNCSDYIEGNKLENENDYHNFNYLWNINNQRKQTEKIQQK